MASPAASLNQPAGLPERCLYVYGLVSASIEPSVLVEAAPGGELESTSVGRVAAVHSWIDPAQLQDIEPDIDEGSRLVDLVRHHDEVVAALASAGPVLPVRLGTLLPDVDSLRHILTGGEDDIVEALERVRDRSEWDLRVSMPQLDAESTETTDHASGAAYLLGRRDARRRAAELRHEVAAAITALDACLADFTEAVAGAEMSGSSDALSRAYLVSDAVQEQFAAAAQEGIAEVERLGCGAVLRGPLPAYSFADVRLEAYHND